MLCAHDQQRRLCVTLCLLFELTVWRYFPPRLLNLTHDKNPEGSPPFLMLYLLMTSWCVSCLGKWCQPPGTCVTCWNDRLGWDEEILLGKSQGHFISEKGRRYFYWWWCKASALLLSLLDPGVFLSCVWHSIVPGLCRLDLFSAEAEGLPAALKYRELNPKLPSVHNETSSPAEFD